MDKRTQGLVQALADERICMSDVVKLYYEDDEHEAERWEEKLMGLQYVSIVDIIELSRKLNKPAITEYLKEEIEEHNEMYDTDLDTTGNITEIQYKDVVNVSIQEAGKFETTKKFPIEFLVEYHLLNRIIKDSKYYNLPSINVDYADMRKIYRVLGVKGIWALLYDRAMTAEDIPTYLIHNNLKSLRTEFKYQQLEMEKGTGIAARMLSLYESKVKKANPEACSRIKEYIFNQI